MGLDPFGRRFHLLNRAGVKVAVWCVDNPFHLLTAIRSDFWRQTILMVTDDWFCAPLRACGAKTVFHLPLAVWPQCFHPKRKGADYNLAGRMVFVGSSRFHEKERFFSGLTFPKDPGERAFELMYAGRRPDFAWWRKALGQPPLWPGAQVRRIGFCAEQASMLWRTFCIETAAAKIPFTLFGDPGWKRLLAADADLRPRVDYYHSLPSVYGQAAYTLNTTSLLLPRGLTQRHFDVWAAGGFLITDQTRGLGIFPEKLISPVCFSHPGQIPRLVRRFDKEPGLKADLAGAWRRLILLRHTYENRVAHIIHRVLNT